MFAMERLAVIGTQMTKPARASAESLAKALDALPTNIGPGLQRADVARSLTHAQAGLEALPAMDASLFNDNVRGRLTKAVQTLGLALERSPVTSKQVPEDVHHFVTFARDEAERTIELLALGAR
ncbi:MAG: hypothetical protein JWN72_381 [Thermoleophilia bacterium]|nr:hypothetical protein [Thermoleophilia bacterium]